MSNDLNVGKQFLADTRKAIAQKLQQVQEEYLSRTPFFVEEGYCFMEDDTDLRIQLRAIKGVPNASYLVQEDGKVFVFKRLVQLVKALKKSNHDYNLDIQAPLLVPAAAVSPLEAVTVYEVVPEGYQVEKKGEDGHIIAHRFFRAALPPVFKSKIELDTALSRLLVGEIIPGAGDFKYRDQPMNLLEPLDLGLLPPAPSINTTLNKPRGHAYSSLEMLEYHAGFDPVTRNMFDLLKADELRWRYYDKQVDELVNDRISEIWEKASSFPLECLNDGETSEGSGEIIQALKDLYPELSMISGQALHDWMDAFQDSCNMLRGWEPSRDTSFVLFLLGKMVDRQYQGLDAREAGTWFAYSVLQGKRHDEALLYTRDAMTYSNAISSLARRVAVAIRFVIDDKKRDQRRGLAITTWQDMMNGARSQNFATLVFSQSGHRISFSSDAMTVMETKNDERLSAVREAFWETTSPDHPDFQCLRELLEVTGIQAVPSPTPLQMRAVFMELPAEIIGDVVVHGIANDKVSKRIVEYLEENEEKFEALVGVIACQESDA